MFNSIKNDCSFNNNYYLTKVKIIWSSLLVYFSIFLSFCFQTPRTLVLKCQHDIHLCSVLRIKRQLKHLVGINILKIFGAKHYYTLFCHQGRELEEANRERWKTENLQQGLIVLTSRTELRKWSYNCTTFLSVHILKFPHLRRDIIEIE